MSILVRQLVQIRCSAGPLAGVLQRAKQFNARSGTTRPGQCRIGLRQDAAVPRRRRDCTQRRGFSAVPLTLAGIAEWLGTTRLSIKVDRPQLSLADIVRLQAVMKAKD